MPRSPISYFGGKGSPKIKNFILNNLPPHKRYIEPFGGGASILLAKEATTLDIYNDVNRAVVNFFKVISNEKTFISFAEKVELLPCSRELYDEYSRTWAGIHDPLEQAIRWFYVQRFSFGANGHSFGVELLGTQSGSKIIKSYFSAVKSLDIIHERMQKVVIECLDWRDALDKYNDNDFLAYCDPPYVKGSRKSGGYAHELTDSDHTDLVNALLEYKGSIVLSGYNNILYQPLLDAGWDIQMLNVCCQAVGRTKKTGLLGKGSILKNQRRIECLWKNPRAISLMS